ncbi:DUF4012 domain-containing protein [Nocardioides endophyticus]|uniref:DUF4012 domain-containing protein n=1 Tax=Nocardioides endophyticus TaxID=1353775 RepID=A0ABP8YZY7_9ACTN
MHKRKVWVAIVLGAALLVAAWVGWTAFRVNQDLTASVGDATTLRSALESGNDATVDAALADLKQHSGDAADRTGGITWKVLQHLPLLGDDARGVAVVSSVIDDLSGDGIAPLVEVSDNLESIVPSNGRIDPDAVAALLPPAAAAHAAFADADVRLSAEDPSGYVERLKSKYRELAAQVDDGARALGSAETAVRVLPTMLGSDRPQTYILVFQNNAEIRATGGLPGAVSLVRSDDGKLLMGRQVAASSFGFTKKPVLPLTPAEREIYGDIVGTFFLDANLQPDFPRAADLWKARWEQVQPESIDGVLSIDPVAISYVLGAIGSISADGVTLTEENAVDQLLHEVYIRYPDPDDQDAFFRVVARAMFDKIAGGGESPRNLMAALAKGADEHRIYVHDFDEAVQNELAGSRVAGELLTNADTEPQVGVYFADGTGAKMSYYLRYDVDLRATYCSGDVQALTGHLRLSSEAPLDAATSLSDYITGGGTYGVKRGDQLVFIRLYGPVNGTISAVTLDGDPITGFPAVDAEGRKVFTAVVQLKPQQKSDLTWRMKTGPGQVGDTVLSVTPSVAENNSSSVVASSC